MTETAINETSTNEEPREEPQEEQVKEASSVRFESSMTLDEAISYFEAIVAGLKKGTINFKQGDSQMTVSPPPHLDVEVRARRKSDKEKISFELAWRTTETSDLQITSE